MLINVPLSWLREYVAVDVPVAELAHLLTMSGIETERKNARSDDWAGIWVGRIVKLERHPNAEKLLLATVDYGKDTRTVVTGATNLKEGDVVPYAEVGATLIDGRTGERFTLSPRSMRGVRSDGMVCSEKELGVGEDHDGILVLDGAAHVGTPLADALGETILACELSPNRSDLLGIFGLAREVSALTGGELREPAVDPYPDRPPDDFRVTIEDAGACPRYDAAFLERVRVGPSPQWLRDRLIAAGMRPINNVVDVTNYVMLELGQPLHAFDRRLLRGGEIRVRPARPGERLRTLDGIDRVLDGSVLVIADAERAVALAGIIGGEESEISGDTTDVVLEVASFENRGIGRTATRLGLLGSEGSAAARRFAWELSPELVPFALRRAIRLIRELGGGEAVGAVDVYPEPREVANIRMPFGHFQRVLGVELGRDEVLDALRRIRCQYAVDGETLVVTPPAWRIDLAIPEDIVEEAARIVGYDRIPTHIPSGPLPLHERHRFEEFRERARDALVGLGLQEVVSYALVDPRWLEALTPDGSRIGPAPLQVTNPTSVEQSVARTTLRASLLDVARRNLRAVAGVALFEISPVYLPRERDLPEERWIVEILLSGVDVETDAVRDWIRGAPRAFDYWDLRGLTDGLFRALAIEPPLREAATELSGLHPGRADSSEADGPLVLLEGQLHPRVAEQWELPANTFLGEIDLAAAMKLERPLVASLPSRYPAAQRDLAVVVDEARTWREVRDEVRSASGNQLEDVALLDVYRGPQIPPERKSFAMHLVFRSESGTLSEEDVERLVRRIAGRLQHRLGAVLRA